MKITQSVSKTSFYETFSDLIFATLAIFVLLMSVFLVQVNVETGLDELLKEIETQSAKRDAEEQRLASRKEELNKLEQQAQSLAQYNFEVVIAVDTTGSMQLELDRLTETIALIARVLPQIADSAKIGVVAYRKNEQDQLDIKEFPLQQILPEEQDNGRSLRQISRFISNLRAQPGSAPLERAIDRALRMFTSPNLFTGHQTFMLLGDVGPYEDRYRDQAIDAVNRQQEQSIIAQLKNWKQASFSRNPLILFSGLDEINKTTGTQNLKFRESRKFFARIAQEMGSPEAYTEDSGEMIPSLLGAILG